MIADDELIMISALQHYLFCKRQCALIHIEGQWQENYLTASGRALHERVDKIASETRRDVHIATSLRLISQRLGVMGVADMVEFHRASRPNDDEGRIIAAKLPRRGGWWRPFPVEYKRGVPKAHRADEVQLCAQAMCLEEMLNVDISEGAIFYGEQRRRMPVAFDCVLRALTEAVAVDVHELLRIGVAPSPVWGRWCTACSLKWLCLDRAPSALAWVANQLDGIVKGDS